MPSNIWKKISLLAVAIAVGIGGSLSLANSSPVEAQINWTEVIIEPAVDGSVEESWAQAIWDWAREDNGFLSDPEHAHLDWRYTGPGQVGKIDWTINPDANFRWSAAATTLTPRPKVPDTYDCADRTCVIYTVEWNDAQPIQSKTRYEVTATRRNAAPTDNDWGVANDHSGVTKMSAGFNAADIATNEDQTSFRVLLPMPWIGEDVNLEIDRQDGDEGDVPAWNYTKTRAIRKADTVSLYDSFATNARNARSTSAPVYLSVDTFEVGPIDPGHVDYIPFHPFNNNSTIIAGMTAAWGHIPGATHYEVLYTFRGGFNANSPNRTTTSSQVVSFDAGFTLPRLFNWDNYVGDDGDTETQTWLRGLSTSKPAPNGAGDIRDDRVIQTATVLTKLLNDREGFNTLSEGDEGFATDEEVSQMMREKNSVSVRIRPLIICAEGSSEALTSHLCSKESQLMGVRAFKGKVSRPNWISYSGNATELHVRTRSGIHPYNLAIPTP